MVQSITTKKEFYSLHRINQPNLNVIYFHGEWVGPCRLFEPKYIELAQQQGNRFPKLQFFKVEPDNFEGIGDEIGLRVMPSVWIYKQGKVVDQYLGRGERFVEFLEENSQKA